MRIPASKLLDLLDPAVPVSLRDANCRLLSGSLSHAEAVAAVVRGEVEGVAARNGRVRFLRQLAPEELAKERAAREEAAASAMESASERGTSTAFARLHLGVYREAVRQAVVEEDKFGQRVVVSSGEIVGHVYTHCGVRGL